MLGFNDSENIIDLAYEKAISTYHRLIACLKGEWGYSDDDSIVIQVNQTNQKIENKKNK